MIRIGRCKYDKYGKRSDPTFPDYIPIVVLMKGHSKWGVLGPYELKDDNGCILENIFQFSKCYERVPPVTLSKSRWDRTIIWSHPAEIHCSKGLIQPTYWEWRFKGMTNPYAVRYPVGYSPSMRSKCLFSIPDEEHPEIRLGYIDARKQIYVRWYCDLVKKCDEYNDLIEMLNEGTNLLIIEVDGPHQETLSYYQEHYGVDDDFIENDTMLATEENLSIMLNDDKHPFGHGYCLAMALLNMEHLAED